MTETEKPLGQGLQHPIEPPINDTIPNPKTPIRTFHFRSIVKLPDGRVVPRVRLPKKTPEPPTTPSK